MSTHIPSKSAQSLFRTLETATSLPRESVIHVGTALLQHLLDGTPVSVETLEGKTGRSREEIEHILDRMEAERGEGGDVIGLGLSLRPTPHQYQANGKIFYGWCAADTLLFPVLLRHTAEVTSRDPVTGKAVQMTVSPNAVERVKPSSARVTWVEDGSCGSLRKSFCVPSRFFATACAALDWAGERRNAEVLSVGDSHQIARTIADQIPEQHGSD